MLCKYLMITFELGLIRTCFFPLFSALFIVLRASASTFIRTIYGAISQAVSQVTREGESLSCISVTTLLVQSINMPPSFPIAKTSTPPLRHYSSPQTQNHTSPIAIRPYYLLLLTNLIQHFLTQCLPPYHHPPTRCPLYCITREPQPPTASDHFHPISPLHVPSILHPYRSKVLHHRLQDFPAAERAQR